MSAFIAETPCIGVFDSGVGGLSILDALARRLPRARLLYLGDTAFAPYGSRSAADVIERCDRIVAALAGRGARLVVVACNTATVLAIDELRRRWPGLEFVGVEPGVKPAAALTSTGRIAIMTTPATAASARLRDLIDRFAAGVHVHVEPCPELAATIERGELDGAALHAALAAPCRHVREADVDTVVLGCTHYPFVAEPIRALIGQPLRLIDTAQAVAERVAARWDRPDAVAQLRVISTRPSEAMTTLLGRCAALSGAVVEVVPI